MSFSHGTALVKKPKFSEDTSISIIREGMQAPKWPIYAKHSMSCATFYKWKAKDCGHRCVAAAATEGFGNREQPPKALKPTLLRTCRALNETRYGPPSDWELMARPSATSARDTEPASLEDKNASAKFGESCITFSCFLDDDSRIGRTKQTALKVLLPQRVESRLLSDWSLWYGVQARACQKSATRPRPTARELETRNVVRKGTVRNFVCRAG